jgi:hypothetical protein
MAVKTIFWHVFYVSVSFDNIFQSGSLNLRNYFRRICTLKPKTVSISNIFELNTCYSCTCFSKERVLELLLSENSYIGINVINRVIALLYYDTILFIFENLLKTLIFFQAESSSERVVISYAMISNSYCVENK